MMHASMPRPPSSIDSQLARAIPLIAKAMADRGHRQEDVSKLTGIPQYQISKILGGKRRRFSNAVERLCQYAEIDGAAVAPEAPELDRLSRTVRRVIGDNPRRAALLTRVLEALAPALAHLEDSPPTPPSVAP